MRSPIISEIFPTPKERAERSAQMQSEMLEAVEAEVDESGRETGQSNLHSRQPRSSGRAEAGSSRSHEAAGQTGSVYLDGEEAMEALVQETSRSFTDIVG